MLLGIDGVKWATSCCPASGDGTKPPLQECNSSRCFPASGWGGRL